MEIPVLQKIEFLCLPENIDPENDNVDVAFHLSNGQVYSLLVATPNNIFSCMDNEGTDYFFGTPPLFVRRIDQATLARAIGALISEDDAKWLGIYGTLQTP